MEISIKINPNAIATTAIFIIGAEILLLYSLAEISRLAMKYSKFKRLVFVANIIKVAKFKR